ncbi:MAG: LacI family DNA-binding transcriptional regulator [Butyrivibrio sp.]|nr:LacI family DNA-binding transcriptional regulator [Butyrivibrio sp.]
MSITAKELAKKLGLSATAVSMALNNKPGVSTDTRQLVIKAAEEAGYDFSRIRNSNGISGSIYVIFYKTHNAILSYTPIFDELYQGVKEECKKNNIGTRLIQFYEKTDSLELCFSELRGGDCIGIILVGTEITKEVCEKFLELNIPLTLLDTYFDSLDCNSVLINNSQGAYLATEYLISITGTQPGYLQSSYPIYNFAARQEGYFKAIKENGMSKSRSIIHRLAPSIEDAMGDMLEILEDGTELARCYFADNDIIAIGAMKALKLRGYKIPEDIAIIGFDNISEGRVVEPSLTTMDVPRLFIGQTAAKQLIEQLKTRIYHSYKIEVSTKMIKRLSHCL